MANATPKGTGPKSAASNTAINVDGSTGTLIWVREATVIRRIRRHLAKSGCTLLKSRPGTRQYDIRGEYAIFDESGELVSERINLSAWLRSYKLLAEHEQIDPPVGKGWKYHVARSRTEVIDGKRIIINEQLTGEYSTEKAARKAAEGITDRDGLNVVGRDSRVGQKADDQQEPHNVSS
ncbi:MAG: hypothetical protein RLZZ09_3308 [Pseudomonadota bacterium]